ncbi:hypothetical protein [Roseateles sp. YR242]|uniref:hypothetical protein n=1 Tax=Roseateles sp. YR242 TaxID=1855305 RepID=UPI0011605E21|nr:hypothetical protein [Roseateles sp. YR242]
MRLSTVVALVAIGSLAAAALCLQSFYQSFRPIPSHLQVVTGTATSVSSFTTLYSKAHATFRLPQPSGESPEFTYKPNFRLFYYFADHLKDGMPVAITLGPGGAHDIWGLKLGDMALMLPEQAREARLTEGRWSLGMFIGMLASALFMGRLARDLRRQGH